MHWKIKSITQNTVSLLPSALSYNTYYWIQRYFGDLGNVTTLMKRVSAGVDTWQLIVNQNLNPIDKIFFEIGTGRVPLVPIAFWLMGAKKTITVDLNRYLKDELLRECLQYIGNHREAFEAQFQGLIDNNRLDKLLAFNKVADFSTNELLELCGIEYIAPGDAASTKLPPQHVDFHTSYTVFEHIPRAILEDILREGSRITVPHGLFVHRIDYSDHFSHSDKNISSINFLQYSDREWMKYANNRYMYMNRLRHDDYIDLFTSVGHHILDKRVEIDEHALELLITQKLQLSEEFKAKSIDTLAKTSSWLVSSTHSGLTKQSLTKAGSFRARALSAYSG